MIYVRSKPDRLVYDAARGGKKIPSDKFVPVKLNPHVARAIEVWEDLEVQPDPVVVPIAAATPMIDEKN
jgi:hypothetical protein